MSNLLNEKREKYYHRQVIDSIGLENVPIAFGAEKTCHIFKSFVVFKEPIYLSDKDAFFKTMLRKLVKFQNTQYLANSGINTPKIVDIELKEDLLFEVQERAPGKVISYTNESNILHSFGKKNKTYASIKDMSDNLRSEFCMQVLLYNFNMQKQLKSALLSHYVKFLKDFKDIQEYGLDLDIHGENFLYDLEKGFWFVDLPYTQSTEIKKFSEDNVDDFEVSLQPKKIKNMERYRQVSDFVVIKQITNLFVDFLKYSSFVFDLELIKTMKKNNVSIIENKIFTAAKYAGFKLTDAEWDNLKTSLNKYSQKKIKPKTDDTIQSL